MKIYNRCERKKRNQFIATVVAIIAACTSTALIVYGLETDDKANVTVEDTPTIETVELQVDAVVCNEVENIVQEAPVSLSEPEIKNVRYELTATERAIVEAVVAAESASESFDGQCLVAQCVLNTAEARDMRPDEVVMEINSNGTRQYAKPNADLSYMVEDAISAVFDDGYEVTSEPVRFFYAPKYCAGSWHENNLEFVLTEGGHRFFKLP